MTYAYPWLVRDATTLTIAVRIVAERTQFGRTDALVTPVAGSGQRWVRKHRLVPITEES